MEFKKSNLKNLMVVELRNGKYGIIVDDEIIMQYIWGNMTWDNEWKREGRKERLREVEIFRLKKEGKIRELELEIQKLNKIHSEETEIYKQATSYQLDEIIENLGIEGVSDEDITDEINFQSKRLGLDTSSGEILNWEIRDGYLFARIVLI